MRRMILVKKSQNLARYISENNHYYVRRSSNKQYCEKFCIIAASLSFLIIILMNKIIFRPVSSKFLDILVKNYFFCVNLLGFKYFIL